MEWGLTMTQRETEAVIEMLDTCEEPIEVERARGIAGTGTSGRATEGEATPTIVPEPEENISAHISHINSTGHVVISNVCIRCSRISEPSAYHEC